MVGPFDKIKDSKLYKDTTKKFEDRVTSKDPSLDPLAIEYGERAKKGISDEIQEMEAGAKWGSISSGVDQDLRGIASQASSSGMRGGMVARQLAQAEAAAIGEYADFRGEQAAADIAEQDKYRLIGDERVSDLKQEKEAAEDDLAAFEDSAIRYDNEQEQKHLQYVTGQQQFQTQIYSAFYQMMLNNPEEFEDVGTGEGTLEDMKLWMEQMGVDTSYFNEIDLNMDYAEDYFSGNTSSTSPSTNKISSGNTAPETDIADTGGTAQTHGNTIVTQAPEGYDFTTAQTNYPSGDGYSGFMPTYDEFNAMTNDQQVGYHNRQNPFGDTINRETSEYNPKGESGVYSADNPSRMGHTLKADNSRVTPLKDLPPEFLTDGVKAGTYTFDKISHRSINGLTINNSDTRKKGDRESTHIENIAYQIINQKYDATINPGLVIDPKNMSADSGFWSGSGNSFLSFEKSYKNDYETKYIPEFNKIRDQIIDQGYYYDKQGNVNVLGSDGRWYQGYNVQGVANNDRLYNGFEG